MAKLNVDICDFCKQIVTREELNFSLVMSLKGNRKKEGRTRAEICNGCFEEISGKINRHFDILNPNTGGEQRVPSVFKEKERVVEKDNECEHERNHFEADRNRLVCRDCGFAQPTY